MGAAYQKVAESEPFLPSPDSVLPALLALRTNHATIIESRAYVTAQGQSLDRAKKQLAIEQANLNDQKLLNSALRKRIAALRNDLETMTDRNPDQIIQERLDKLEQKRRNYDEDTSKLMKVFNKFIDDHLAAMLAAEELGGPVVGDMMDIDTEDLVAGFSTQGKLKKSKGSADQEVRQRRIDDIWGEAYDQGERKMRKRDEATAAGQEMRELTEQLLNRLMESGGDSSAAYVKLARESAAARFLVRSKVAQFHPKDATRLRLVDFGRELDD
jgi:hypothetical protein